ncbi:MAG: phosphoribosylformylglycinamidine synthase [Candidatus Falkowbacteria bacterium]
MTEKRKNPVSHYYRQINPNLEFCFNVEVSEPLTSEEENALTWLLAETFSPQNLTPNSQLRPTADKKIIEVGPLLNFATPWNTNALSILRSCGISKITRIERSIRRLTNENVDYDRMMEGIYPEPLQSFASGLKPAEVYDVPLMEKGLAAYDELQGLSMDAHDKQAYYDYFVGQCGRNPTIVELIDLNNANSEHSRHGYFKGRQIIDGVLMPETLMDIVKSTLKEGTNSLLAFCDNSSVIRGTVINTIIPEKPGFSSFFVPAKLNYHFLFTAETHNFPSGIAPIPGAETGAGGRIRDVQATGRGGLMLAGTAGYCVGNLHFGDHFDRDDLPWEKRGLIYPSNLATPLEILIKASNGASDYGNKIGEPLIQGFVRAGALFIPNGAILRREWLKPIMFTGGIGQINDLHLIKQEAQAGMLIVEIGGFGYRIGFGGGAASSLMQGENKAELDFNAVQRGDPEMAQKVNRVVRACCEMGETNPIVSIHDQGAGGPANVLKELVEKSGGRIDIRKINVGDPSMSVLEIWVCEFQERNGILISPDRIAEFQAICRREKVPCELLGEASDDGHFVLEDSLNGTTPVNMELNAVLGGMPQKTFSSEHLPKNLVPFNTRVFHSEKINEALNRVLHLPSIGSKRFLINKVDRSVTGLIAQQQCCGPLHLPVSDVAVVSHSHFPNDLGLYAGAAMSIGEQPIKMLVNAAAGARMAGGEALTNIVWARLSSLGDIKCSANWMGAPKLPGEGAEMYDAACALRDFMVAVGIAVDGGKDSMSMVTMVPDGNGQIEMVKSPLSLVISAYCTVPDITKVITPDIKAPGKSRIMRIDLASGRRRLGGSALAQVFEQIGHESPDIDDPKLFVAGFEFIQNAIDMDLILAGHDISDGGMIVALLEMLFSGNCGFQGVFNSLPSPQNVVDELFAEEAGFLIEYFPENEDLIVRTLRNNKIPYSILGKTLLDKHVSFGCDACIGGACKLIDESMLSLRSKWEDTSYKLEFSQCAAEMVREENVTSFDRSGPAYKLSFKQKVFGPECAAVRFPVAIIREEGNNGDREMTSAFFQAGFEPRDVNMDDLVSGRVDLADFRGIIFAGGFSYADVLDSAKGWAGVIKFNKKVKAMFDEFYQRSDTFSLGVCNGCQLSALLGFIPGGGIDDVSQPRFIKNNSGRYESRFSTVVIKDSPAIMLQGMAGAALGIWVAHGEGKLFCPDEKDYKTIIDQNLAPIRYADDEGNPTMTYPLNPNGSPDGIAALCDSTGRHLAMMPHPERTFLKWQWPYWPSAWKEEDLSPWSKMFQNAYEWCLKH